MDIGIIGAGAMGCLYACLLGGQHRVTLYDISPAVVDTINRQGITLWEPAGTRSVYRVPAQFSGQGVAAPELLILFVKDLYSESALETNRALIGPTPGCCPCKTAWAMRKFCGNSSPAHTFFWAPPSTIA